MVLGHAWYTPERDGNLESYLEKYDGESAFPLFHGMEQYRMLWDMGYLEPQISVIRIMWNIGRYDEHYTVIDDKHLEGIEAPAHSGKPGIHTVDKIISSKGPAFEAYTLNPYPIPRK